MDIEIPLKNSVAPLLVSGGVGFLAAMLLFWLAYPVCALLLLLATAWEVWRAWRVVRTGPLALYGQGMRWWKVEASGELVGPFWLDVSTRQGAHWMTLCLRDASHRRCRLFLGTWCVAAEPWRKLKWRILEQARHLEKLRPVRRIISN